MQGVLYLLPDMPLSFRHLTSTAQITRADADVLLSRAMQMEKIVEQDGGNDLLKRKVMAVLFYEPSTRTRLSFETAMLRLGGQIITAEGIQFSSLFKGESIEDTIMMAAGYADIIAMRHPEIGSADKAARVSPVPFINAGDGAAQHPTQALLDLLTIQKEVGRFDGITVAFATDPLHSRTIKSLAQILTLYKPKEYIFISPESLQPTKEFIADLEAKGITCRVTTDFNALHDADVLYMNRLQQERFEDQQEFERLRRNYILTADMLKGSDTVIMDPLPRVDEIDISVDALPTAAYFRQAKNGLYMRMALLAELLGEV